MKRAPCPRPALSASTRPPCSSRMWRTMASPRPRPPWRRVLELSACRKRSNRCGRNSGVMPCPVSVTVMTTSAPAPAHSSSTRPPRGVNLIALESRFQTTCCRRPGSPETTPAIDASCDSSAMSFASAARRTVSIAASTTEARSTGRASIRSFPETMRETSSRSSISCAWSFALSSIVARARALFASSR